MKPRYLTKSRFKLALECPTKLYYCDKSEYANQNLEDPFLNALAEGGFQVGELAKCYFPGGVEIDTLAYDEALNLTNQLLNRDNVTIFEAAIRFNNLFIRADIFVKKGKHIDLIEVKAKSFDKNKDSFINKRNKLDSDWSPYLYDTAFQKYVVSHAFPEYSVSAYLMLADKNSLCPTDGLNQKFKIIKNEYGRKQAIADDITKDDLTNKLICKINVDDICKKIYDENISDIYSFEEYVNRLSKLYFDNKKEPPIISSLCGKCEFKATEQELKNGLKSGFNECWKEALNWTDKDLSVPTVLEIWNHRGKDKFIQSGKIKLSDICVDDISPETDGKSGLSSKQRQWMQIDKVQRNDNSYWIDTDNLINEMKSWQYPLHFIDFETTRVAIPFNNGRHPYEGIAFQFSHHIVYKDGRIEHHGQYLNTEGFPNYDFVRNLKNELDNDEGSIFKYSAHENSFLNEIYKQLINDKDNIPDRDELCKFIRSITEYKEDKITICGKRNMIDLLVLVKRYFYDPATKGSNSIKYVLPAILNCSKYLQQKYSNPIYGSDQGLKSLNYKDWKWIEYENGRVVDPYKLLPRMFADISDKDYELLSESDEIRDGGAALTAYARLQYENMSDFEKQEIKQALLKYCELDTLAMVMIYEGWLDLTGQLE